MKLPKEKRKRTISKETHRLVGFFFVLLSVISLIHVPIRTAYAEELTETELEVLETINSESNGIAPDKNSLHAYAALLYDANAGRVLYEKNGYEVLPMASTTKIMTLLVVLENTAPEDVVTVSQNAAKQPDVQLNMNTGEQYYVKNLCYSLMLESHNDTAVALAEHVGGSVEGFAELMNAKAKALGAYSANFVTPNGLDADGHGITAADLARIAAYAVKQEDFREITTTKSHSFTELTKGRGFTVNNKDAFLSMMDGAIGVKTGFTGKAGYCFVGALERSDRLLISVVLASGWPPHKTYKWNDTMRLMNYGVKGFSMLPLMKDVSELPELPKLPVLKGQDEAVKLQYAEDTVAEALKQKLLQNGTEQIHYQPEFFTATVTAPVIAGTTVGELTITINNECIKKIPIQTAEAVVPVDFNYYFQRIIDWFFKPSLPFLQ